MKTSENIKIILIIFIVLIFLVLFSFVLCSGSVSYLLPLIISPILFLLITKKSVQSKLLKNFYSISMNLGILLFLFAIIINSITFIGGTPVNHLIVAVFFLFMALNLFVILIIKLKIIGKLIFILLALVNMLELIDCLRRLYNTLS